MKKRMTSRLMMKNANPFLLSAWIILVFSWLLNSASATAEIIYEYDFEPGWDNWSVDNGVWEIGTPPPEITTCHGGAQCAGTVLGGDYPGDTDSRLISPSITLPVVTRNEEIHLRFWQWFWYSVNDAGYVQISVYDEETKTWSGWWTIGNSVYDNTYAWSLMAVDLTDYAGEKVRIAFYHTAYSWPWGECGPGWYVDDIDLTGIPECTDGDGDGYNIEGGGCGAIDCDDDPSDDAEQCPSQGGACVCGEPDCGLCAECVNPGAEEICGDDE